MNLTQDQISDFSSAILFSDVHEYIKNNQAEYEAFVEAEEKIREKQVHKTKQ